MATGPDVSKFSTNQLHEMTGRDRRWIKQRLADQQVAPIARDGRTHFYPVRAALEAIYGRQRPDASAERARLDRARAEREELELEVRRGTLVPALDQDQVAIALATSTSGRLQGIPRQVAPELAATTTTAGCERIVEREIHRALRDLADAGERALERLQKSGVRRPR